MPVPHSVRQSAEKLLACMRLRGDGSGLPVSALSGLVPASGSATIVTVSVFAAVIGAGALHNGSSGSRLNICGDTGAG
jgi:hypothetical protein